jgi:hypothetical protein
MRRIGWVSWVAYRVAIGVGVAVISATAFVAGAGLYTLMH